MTGLGSEDVALDIGFGFVLHDDDVPGVDRAYLGTFVVVLHAFRHDGAERKRESGMYDERTVSAQDDEGEHADDRNEVPGLFLHGARLQSLGYNPF